MTAAALALAALLAVVVVVVVARPFLRRPGRREEPGALSDEQLGRIRLAEERDRALAALKELEFDHRTGKISDEDYSRLVGPLRSEAADALAAIEREDTPA
jgi:hypothetical protein